MFDFGRDLRRRFQAGVAPKSMRGGVFKGAPVTADRSLYELLDLSLLTAEAQSAEAVAARGVAEPAIAALRAASLWREVARRAGDAVALRKAAAHAETAAAGASGAALTRARCEQAQCALLGAELFGDEGLTAAAGHTLTLTAASPMARALAAGLAGRAALAKNDFDEVLASAQALEAPLRVLKAEVRGRHDLRLAQAEQVAVRADLLIACGARLKDRALIDLALRELGDLRRTLDPAYEPLAAARVDALRGGGLVLAGETSGDVSLILDGVELLTGAVDLVPPDHSPLDWARLQAALGLGLQSLGEATTDERSFEQAVTALDRARGVLADHPALQLTAIVANNRALCLARCAELTGDLAVLDAAEAALKTELVSGQPRRHPVAWALTQVNLARLYEARVEITGRDRGQRAAAAIALTAAFDVFVEEGLRSLASMASDSLERLRAGISAA